MVPFYLGLFLVLALLFLSLLLVEKDLVVLDLPRQTKWVLLLTYQFTIYGGLSPFNIYECLFKVTGV